jgi:membrane protease YdiL (CAAX protease family)
VIVLDKKNVSKNILSTIGWFLIFNVSQLGGILFLIVQYFLEDSKRINQNVDLNKMLTYIMANILPVLILSYVILAVILLICIKIKKVEPKEYLRINNNNLDIKSYIAFFSFGLFVNIILSIIFSFLPQNLQGLDQSVLFKNNNMVLVFLTIGILGPIIEEIIFRNRIYNNLLAVNTIFAIITQAVLFGIAHGNPLQFVYTSILALVFVYVDDKYDSLIPSICMHMGLNTFACIQFYNEIAAFVITGSLCLISVLEYKKIYLHIRK